MSFPLRLNIFNRLWAGEDLNLHALRRYHLKVVRLPVSPPARKLKFSVSSDNHVYLIFR